MLIKDIERVEKKINIRNKVFINMMRLFNEGFS